MGLLALGLVLFLGLHSVRIFAEGWRAGMISRLGANGWKGLYSLGSLAGFGLIVIGFGRAGPQEPLWQAPAFVPHITALLVLPAFILIAAAYVPANHFKAKIGHPMLAGTKIWAFAHLLVNSQPRDLLLFGAFLVWAIADFAASRRRDRKTGVTYPAGKAKGDAITIAVGLAAWLLFAFYLHQALIGVRPFPSH
jgi:uncharacterized membrane protein